MGIKGCRRCLSSLHTTPALAYQARVPGCRRPPILSVACPSQIPFHRCRQLVLSAPQVAAEEQADSVFHQMQVRQLLRV